MSDYTSVFAVCFVILCLATGGIGIYKTIKQHNQEELEQQQTQELLIALNSKVAEPEMTKIDNAGPVFVSISDEEKDQLKQDINSYVLSNLPEQKIYVPTASCLIRNTTTGMLSLECVKE